MGTSYGIGPSGRWVLSCDEDGKSDGTVRKVRCPFGYCYRAHLCKTCRAPGSSLSARLGAPWGSREYHLTTKCDVRHAEFVAERAREESIRAAGGFVRCSAMYTDANDPETGDRLTQVVFLGAAGSERWCLMRSETYNSIPLGTIATPDDYARLGRVVPGPVGYQGHGRHTVADVLTAWAAPTIPAPVAPEGAVA